MTSLLQRFEGRSAIIGIVGLGYVGLPLALTAAKKGFTVLGFDINQEWVRRINSGESVIKHIPLHEIAGAIANKTFTATSDLTRLSEPDAIIICVPTPLTRHREPDMTYIEETAKTIASHLRADQLVVLESTTYPRTTDEVLRPILETSGLRSGVDFYLAFSPEREDPGNQFFDTAAIPKVVGGDGPDALKLANSLYEQLIVKTVPVSSTSTAEAVKLTENIFRAVNIALVNELKLIYDAMGIDVWEVIEAAKTKPFGFMPFYPGPGLGGHCIPIDPFYLTWKAREFDISTRFIELAGEINTRMPYHVVNRVADALDKRAGKSLSSSTVLIIGLSYKKNIDDLRESPSLKLFELLESRGAIVEYHDSYFPIIPITREHADLAAKTSVSLDKETLQKVDLILIATDHDNVDYRLISQEAKIIIDTRNVFARMGIQGENIIKA
ncbi:nucleotide sugar dehydrogenase [Phyllobacterium sp. SB3]|uniref:nucleotide sugar dehydrogenase n=1 Tax=Phyllobacterium sp. SB3 TaxID=3156073 RepID=UPI0032AED5B3